MATSNLTMKCETCQQERTTYSCPGCSKYFCINDLNKHHEELEVKFHHIEHQRNEFAQILDDHNKRITNHALFNEINQWEATSIDKIKQTAQQQRNIVQQSLHQYNQRIQINLSNFTEQMKEIEKKKDFNEMVLNNLQKQLENLQNQLNQPTNIHIQQDSSSTFINKISVIVSPFEEPQEFATPGTYNKLPCKGRPCARCGKCRDWYFTGDAATLAWLRSVNDWSYDGIAGKRWRNDGIYDQFKRRHNATCRYGYHDHGGHIDGDDIRYLTQRTGGGGRIYGGHGGRITLGCFCEDNI